MKENLVKICLFILALGFMVAPIMVQAAPESEVKMSVSVLARKSTDTINDFDFSTVNRQLPLKRVAGTSTQNFSKSSLFQKIKDFLIRR